MDDFFKIIESLVEMSGGIGDSANQEYVVDEREELRCIKLHGDGWKQDGFDYAPNSRDIVTYWKKDGQDRREIRLTASQQRRWIHLLEIQQGMSNE